MSNLDKYLAHLDGVTGYRRNLVRTNKLVGDQSTLLGSHALAQHATSGEQSKIQLGIGSAAGLVVGGMVGYKHGHWMLGVISGTSIGTNVPALLSTETRSEALWNLAQTHGGVLASLAAKDEGSKKKAVLFVLGYLGVGLARHFYGEGK